MPKCLKQKKTKYDMLRKQLSKTQQGYVLSRTNGNRTASCIDRTAVEIVEVLVFVVLVVIEEVVVVVKK